MWNPSSKTNEGAAMKTRRRTGAMAQRRRLVSSRMTGLFCGGLLLVTALVGMVSLSNSVNGMRASIAELEDNREFLEAHAALLQARWNQATLPAVIIARASSELALMLPENPGQVLLTYEPESANNGSRWLQLFDGFGGGDPAVAGESTIVLATPEGRLPAGALNHE